MKSKNVFDKNKLIEVLSKRAVGFFYSEEVLEYGEREEKKSASKDSEDNSSQKNQEKSVSVLTQNQNQGVYSPCETGEVTINTENTRVQSDENKQNLVLLKKKVTTHYIPPDITAVKMLLENFGEEVKGNNFINELSDEELLKLKDEIIKNL